MPAAIVVAALPTARWISATLVAMTLNLEGTLLERLRKIAALDAGTTVAGEREAARRAASEFERGWRSYVRGSRTTCWSTRCKEQGSPSRRCPARTSI